MFNTNEKFQFNVYFDIFLFLNYSNFHSFEECGKNVVIKNQCKGKDLLISEGTFANVIITVGAYCHDTTVPGACMLTLQQQFTKCFGQVGLDPAVYFSNITAHKGAILGTNKAMADKYCRYNFF